MAAIAASDLKAEFPVLDREGLVYLDSAATAQKPRTVIEALTDLLAHHNASVHRGVYPLAVEATDRFENARRHIAEWLNWPAQATVFTANATAAINLVAYAWGRANVGAGDLVVLTEMEHHSNLVPWLVLAEERGARLEHVPIDEEGRLVLSELERLLEQQPKLVGAVHVSNVLGTINPIADIVARARAAGAATLVDGSQAVPQLPVDLAAIDADFYVWTGHKAYGPTGVGVLHGRPEVLDAMPPFLGGGHMISAVGLQSVRFAEVPAKFEAGTSPIAEVVGLGAAVAWLRTIGMEAVREHERDLTAYALERLADVPGLDVHGPREADERGALVSFSLDHAHPHDTADILGRAGVCVRAGHHCAQPLMKRLGVGATTRASFAVHNGREDVDALIAALDRVAEIFGD